MIIPQDNDYAVDIFKDITVVNFTEDEANQLKTLLFQETGNKNIFYYIKRIYNTIKANFKEYSKIIIIPYTDEDLRPHLIIQKISLK